MGVHFVHMTLFLILHIVFSNGKSMKKFNCANLIMSFFSIFDQPVSRCDHSSSVSEFAAYFC